MEESCICSYVLIDIGANFLYHVKACPDSVCTTARAERHYYVMCLNRQPRIKPHAHVWIQFH